MALGALAALCGFLPLATGLGALGAAFYLGGMIERELVPEPDPGEPYWP
jgi:hypothetical protein